MAWIDRYAYSNRLRHGNPGQKAALVVLVLLLCLVLNRPAVGLLAAAWMVLLATVWAGVPWRAFGGALLGQGSFLLWAVVGVAVQVGTVGPPAYQLSPLPLYVTRDTMATAGLLFTRALGCAAAMNFLAFTTPLTDLLDLGRRLRVPQLLLDLATLIYRFLFVLLESMARMIVAQEARLGYSNWRRSMHSAAQVAATLFINSFRQSQRLHLALSGRGYTGELRVLPNDYQQLPLTWPLAVTLTATLLLATII